MVFVSEYLQCWALRRRWKRNDVCWKKHPSTGADTEQRCPIKPQRRLSALLLHMTHPAILCHPSTPPGLHDARWQIPSSTSCGWSKALENTLAVSEKVACAAQCRVITTSTQSIKNMQFVFNSLPLDPKYFSIQEKTFQRHFSRVNANIVTTLAWIPSGRCMDLYLCKGRVGELATHKRYWFRNCLP